MTERIKVSEAVGRTLAHLGAAHVFGVVGSGNFHVTNALLAAGVGFTATRHEMGAACMADAYARATGRVAVVSVHQGCGFTNALTGVGEAAKCRTPVLVVAGDTPPTQKMSNFWIDQDSAARSVGAVAERIHAAETAVADAARAFSTALLLRRTVVLSLPIDLQEQMVDFSEADVPELLERIPPAASPDGVRRLARLLADAERPVIVGGRGAWGAVAELRRLAEASGALLTTSAAGRGLFAGDEWHLDVMGGFSTDGAAELISRSDLVVAFGASLNRWTTRSGSLLRGARVVQVDDTPEAIGFHRPVDLGVLGDSAAVAAAVAAELAELAPDGRRGYRTAETGHAVRASRHWSEQPFEDRGGDGLVDPRALTNALDALLPMDRVVVPDGGNFNAYPAMLFRVPDHLGYCVPLAFQSIGLALASGIGAGVALPGRMPVVGVGDGGMMMSLVELDTAVRLGLGMVVVVYNDSAYGAEVHHFEHETDRLGIVEFPETDIAAIARGFGCEALTVRAVEDLEPVRAWLSGPRDRPLVIDAKIAAFPSWVLAHTFDGE
jgi:thiamine pyrophosphate-dependent acetolactate synthase large subunit-like protein